MEEYILKETTVWSHFKSKDYRKHLRILQSPFIDHEKIYAYKPRSQRGAARTGQTFIVSYPYRYDDNPDKMEKEKTWIESITSTGLRFHKEDCTFRGQPAHMILIMNPDVHLEAVKRLLPDPE